MKIRLWLVLSLILAICLVLGPQVLAEETDLENLEEVAYEESTPDEVGETLAGEEGVIPDAEPELTIVEEIDTVSSDGEALPTEEAVAEPVLISAPEGEVQDDGVIIGGWDSVVEDELEGVEVEEVVKMPTTWGNFWNNVKERVAVTLTFDPIKKAEKQLKYAERHMKIAEYVAEHADSEKAQALAERAVVKAQKYMEKIEAKKDKWIENIDDRARGLYKNIVTHQIRKENILDKLEEKLPEEKLEKLREMRENGLKKSQRFLNAIENDKIPEEVKEHLKKVKSRVENHVQEVKEFNQKKRELLRNAKDGDESAKEELEALRENRQEEVQNRVQERREVKETLREAVESGDEQALQKLKRMNVTEKVINRARLNAVEKRRENIVEKKQELREDIKAGNEEAKKQLKKVNQVQKKVIEKKQDLKEKVINNKPLPKPLPKPVDKKPEANKIFSPGGWD